MTDSRLITFNSDLIIVQYTLFPISGLLVNRTKGCYYSDNGGEPRTKFPKQVLVFRTKEPFVRITGNGVCPDNGSPVNGNGVNSGRNGPD